METNEQLQTTLVQEAEAEMVKLLKRVQDLKVGDLKGVEHEVLTSVFAIGRKTLERIIQAQPETVQAPARREGACGHEQRQVGQRPKRILTLLGKITIQRAYYQCLNPGEEQQCDEEPPCTHGEAPADALWGIEQRRTSAGVQQAVSYLGALLPLEEAAAAFSRLFPLQMSARQALYLMQPVGEALAAVEQEQVNALWQEAGESRTTPSSPLGPPEEGIERFYIQLDGVLARLRRGSVPMEQDEQQRAGDVYREIKVGAVFQAQRGRERSELAPGAWVDEPVEGSLHYVAQRTALGDFGRRLYVLAVQGGLRRAKQVVVLGDGARWLWRVGEEHFPGAVQIVDIWHAQEHVWEVAHAVFGRTTPEGVAWARQGCTWLVQGQIEALVQAIAALPPVAPPPGQTKSIPEQAIGYFTTNAERMRYPAFRAQGMQIGSGIAEAACKTVVSTRAKRAGMRWTPEGLDALLPLRAAVLNGSYDAFWQGHSHALV
jgi:hypothetical protein